MHVKTIIFDMYGVILKDPEGGLMPYINSKFPGLTFDDVYYPHWIDACMGKLSSLDFFKNLGFEGDLRKIEKEYLDTIEIDDSFFEIVPALTEYYRLALLSNDLSEWSKYLRDKFKINDYFDVTIISGDVNMIKPDVRIFELMLSQLGQPADSCVYIDDRRKNLSSAKSLGMEAVLFNSRNVFYDGKSVKNFHELAQMLTVALR